MSNTNSTTITHAVAILRHELLTHGEVYKGRNVRLV